MTLSRTAIEGAAFYCARLSYYPQKFAKFVEIETNNGIII